MKYFIIFMSILMTGCAGKYVNPQTGDLSDLRVITRNKDTGILVRTHQECWEVEEIAYLDTDPDTNWATFTNFGIPLEEYENGMTKNPFASYDFRNYIEFKVDSSKRFYLSLYGTYTYPVKSYRYFECNQTISFKPEVDHQYEIEYSVKHASRQCLIKINEVSMINGVYTKSPVTSAKPHKNCIF